MPASRSGDEKKAYDFLNRLRDELQAEDLEIEGFGSLSLQLEGYPAEIRKNSVLPISVLLAIRKYKEWEMTGYQAGPSEKKEATRPFGANLHIS